MTPETPPKTDLDLRATLRLVFDDLLGDAAARVVRKQTKQLARTADATGWNEHLVEELQRTARIDSDWVDSNLRPIVVAYAGCFAAVIDADQLGGFRRGDPGVNAGHHQVHHMIATVAAAIAAGLELQETIDRMLEHAPAIITRELLDSIEKAVQSVS